MAHRRAEKDGGPGLTPEGRCRCALPNGPAARIRQPAPYPLCSPYIHASRERKSLAIFSCIFGHYFLRATFCWRNSASAKVVQLSLELDFCWRNSASAKVVQLSLELLCHSDAQPPHCHSEPKVKNLCHPCAPPAGGLHHMPVHRRRPAPGLSAALGKRRLANGQTAASAKKQATFAGIGFLLAQFRERESRTTFAGIGFLLAQFRERESRTTFAGIALSF